MAPKNDSKVDMDVSSSSSCSRPITEEDSCDVRDSFAKPDVEETDIVLNMES